MGNRLSPHSFAILIVCASLPACTATCSASGSAGGSSTHTQGSKPDSGGADTDKPKPNSSDSSDSKDAPGADEHEPETPEVVNQDPDCNAAAPSVASIWPPNHEFVAITIAGLLDPEGTAIAVEITSIFQDEPVDTEGDGEFVPDGRGVGSSQAEVRAERVGTKKRAGNGRVYTIEFTATDAKGGACSSKVKVGVPHDVKDTAVDDGGTHDSTAM